MTYMRAIVIGLACALIGAALGMGLSYVLIAPLLGITGFEGASGTFAVFGGGPVGAAAGFIVGVIVFLRRQGVRSFGALLGHLAIVLGAPAVLFGGVYWYLFVKQNPVNPNGPPPQLQFEIRLPAGATLPPSTVQIEIYLYASRNRAKADIVPEQFRRDGDRPVIVGSVALYNQADQRLLVLLSPGELGRIFEILLRPVPEETTDFTPWQAVHSVGDPLDGGIFLARKDDGHEVRYRVAWPAPGRKTH